MVLVEVITALALIGVFGSIVTWIVIRVARRAGASRSVTSSVREWAVVLMIMLAVASVASITGISTEFTTLTLSGIAGLAVSLALQSTFSNVIAGVLMLRDGVVRVGDMVEFSSVKGEVVKVSMRTTWIRREDGVIVVIGNGNLSSGPIINHTAKERLAGKIER